MATKALLDVLEQTIGKYVKNLDAESLNVAVWSGKIELQNLQLDCDAVNLQLDRQAADAPNLAVPLRVTEGSFRSLQVDVPWRRITSDPVVMRASGLTVTVEPYDRTAAADFLQAVHTNEDKRAQNVREARTKKVAEEDEYRKRSNALKNLAAADLEGGDQAGFGARLVRRILENLQVEISDVHIELHGSGCETGVVLESLELRTTDQNGKPTFVDRTKSRSSFLFKSLRIRGLGLYMDEDEMTKMDSIREEEDTEGEAEHSYILAPLSFEAKLRQADSDICEEFPRYLLSSELDCLSILLSHSQLQLAHSIAAQIKPSQDVSIPLFPEYRPVQRINSDTAKQWWRYAVRCIGRLNGRRSWAEFYLAFSTRRRYIPLYKRHAHFETCPWMTGLSDDEKQELAAIEDDRSISVGGIMQWRSLADAQVAVEKEKHAEITASNKPSLLYSIFGTAKGSQDEDDGVESTPVQLSATELKDLEAVQAATDEDECLSKDSKLCNVAFTLGAFKVVLTRDYRPLVSLQMGTVLSRLEAMANGAFDFSFSLSSLEVSDKSTIGSMFPVVLRNQGGKAAHDTFLLELKKSDNGDQQVYAKLSTFEAVASPDLILAIQRFFTKSYILANHNTKATNAILRQSMSGSVDLFYDAADFGLPSTSDALDSPAKNEAPGTSVVTERLIDAWKTKTSTKANWSIDLDLSAPIGVVPESSTNPSGNVLIFDLGRFRLQYGSRAGSNSDVDNWFQLNPRQLEALPTREHGSFKADHLTFIVSKADEWTRLVSKDPDNLRDGNQEGSAVIEPMSFQIFFGIETSPGAPSRVPLFGTMPSISINVSVSQIGRFKGVIDKWSNLFSSDDLTSEELLPEDSMSSSMPSRQADEVQASGSSESCDNVTPSSVIPLYFAAFTLKRCSLRCLTDAGSSVEANLISVQMSYEMLSNRSSTICLSMGWFWMLDNLKSDFFRIQRLLAHSTLDESAIAMLQGDAGRAYDKIEEILMSKQKSSNGHEDGLAKISIRSSRKRFGDEDPWDSAQFLGDGFAVNTIVDADFKSLHVNWNPSAIKLLVVMGNKFLGAWSDQDESAIILDKPRRERSLSYVTNESSRITVKGASVDHGKALFRFQFEGFILSLHSAQDDAPLFIFTMLHADIRGVLEPDRKRVAVGLGDLRAETSSTGKTIESFSTVLGLSPGHDSKQLLAVDFIEQSKTRNPSHGTLINISLSPVRLIYIHAQIMALVEYTTEGILGALTAQVAATTVAAAAEYASNAVGDKLVCVETKGAQILIPKAAYDPDCLSFTLEGSSLQYEAIDKTGFSTVAAKVMGVMIKDGSSTALQRDPVELTVSVDLPPFDVGTMDDQAMKVQLDFPMAAFILSKRQYALIFAILNKNMGDTDLYLREEQFVCVQPSESDASLPLDKRPKITHAGNSFVEKVGRTFVDVCIGSLSLELTSGDEEPLFRFTSSKACVSLKLLSDQAKTVSTVSLSRLECLDNRIESIGRQYRSLIFQPEPNDEKQNDNESSGLFNVSYEGSADGSSNTTLQIGSPCFVFIPDAINSLLDFVSSDSADDRSAVPPATEYHKKAPVEPSPGTRIDCNGSDLQEVETVYAHQISSSTATTLYQVATARCSIIFVDLGSDAAVAGMLTSSAAETAVIDGCFVGHVKIDKDASGIMLGMDSQLDVDALEAYTAFGAALESPLQILDPTRFSLYFSMKSGTDGSEMDLRAAAVEPIDVCISMRNIALANAISSTISESFESGSKDAVTDAADETTDTPSKTSSVKLTLPEMKVTFVNDLQGLDEALVRVSTKNLVVSGQTRTQGRRHNPPFTAFDLNIHTSVLSDFFDSSSMEWKPFLQKPWELSLKSKRSEGERFQSTRPSTTVDIESFPCSLSFSELFLMNLASAYRMWSVYSTATQYDPTLESNGKEASIKERRSIAISAARTFVSSLPYACENHSGLDLNFAVSNQEKKACTNGSMEFFRFDPPREKGKGGKRLYGQDIPFGKQLCIFDEDRELFQFENVDEAVGSIPCPVQSTNGTVTVASILREGKTTVCHISSGVDIENRTSLSFDVAITDDEHVRSEVGRCLPTESNTSTKRAKTLITQQGRISKPTRRFGIPASFLRAYYGSWASRKETVICFLVTPEVGGARLEGTVRVALSAYKFDEQGYTAEWTENVTCYAAKSQGTPASEAAYPFALQVRITAFLSMGLPIVKVALEPRAAIENNMPISISVKTPMPHTFSRDISVGDETIHDLEPEARIEVFTPGPSVAISVACKDLPVGGTPTSWMDLGWIDLPLVSEFQIPEPIQCQFPFARRSLSGPPDTGGSSFLVAEGKEGLSSYASGEAVASKSNGRATGENEIELALDDDAQLRTFVVTSIAYAVDHTGEVFFEDLAENLSASSSAILRSSAVPLGAFKSHRHHGRISLLPGSSSTICLLHLTMEGDEGVRRSFPFRVEDVTICEGGLDSTPLLWEDGLETGFYAYRRLLSSHQSELHVIPEYVVYNGSATETVVIREVQGTEVTIPPGEIGALHTQSQAYAAIAIGYQSYDARTSPVRVDALGLRIASVKDRHGNPIGQVAIQTVVGAQDSKLVVKLGAMRSNMLLATEKAQKAQDSFFSDDHFRFRVQWTELRVSLFEARSITDMNQAVFESALDHISKTISPSKVKGSPLSKLPKKKKPSDSDTWVRGRTDSKEPSPGELQNPVCTLLFYRFTVDWQRVFKEEGPEKMAVFTSPERSQLSVIVHNVQVRDETPTSPYPIVLDSSSGTSFFDLCIRTRGSINEDHVEIDLFDLNLAHAEGRSQKITINTNEAFVWKLLDLADRILAAASEFAGFEIKLTWDEENERYLVSFEDPQTSFIDAEARYQPPKSDTILHMKKMRVSPFSVVVSFKRKPETSRYKIRSGVRGANAMNYFSRKLKFKIEKAELKFARYEAANIEGPPDRVMEILSTVYLSRAKMKLVTILTASTFQDWKTLASRDGGDDEFVDGDILRATGNIAGKTANLLLRKAGSGIGSGVSNITHAIGYNVENATSVIGARGVGAGINSIVSGVGDGVGDTISGVGSGAGQILKGAGQGVGQLIGGVSGGALMIGKGIGKGITEADGKAVASGFVNGATSIGTGVGRGVGSVVTGTAGGVASVGQGLFSGVKNVGLGIGGAFTGKKTPRKKKPPT